MKTFPKDFEPIVNIVLRSKSADEAYTEINKITDFSMRLATQFYVLYEGKKTPVRDAFKNFYNDVKTGKYVFEGEMNFIRKFIKEHMMVESIQEYQALLDKHDFDYDMSDDMRLGRIGREMEHRMRQAYKALSDEEKQSAAIMYRDKLVTMDYRKGSQYNTSLKNWNPEAAFDPNSFDGIFYKGA